ncbi:MAG TPA: cysteine desulfurase family protein [Thermotogota bacterium]|nr:cysteine desulfurase family protein [Thermotogota bacterium]HPJ87630.1 cysteine desulfurase family protein [Thermotogota bacterium]HPR94932.1 cysteine desulfurase family protein [Thermotogota bacterium]
MNKIIYLDYYRTTKISELVTEKMKPYQDDNFYLPVSFTQLGTDIAEAIEDSIVRIKKAFNAPHSEVIFASSGTHANNMVIQGILRDAEPENTSIVTSVIDHPSINNVFDYYKKKGFEVKKIKVDSEGFWNTEMLSENLNEKTRLVSITLVNHTIGTVQRYDELKKIIHEKAPNALIHLDITMAVMTQKIDFEELEADFMTLSGHKIYGPKGIGVVIARKPIKIKPITFGTVVTSPFAPGADNVPGIVGISYAIEQAVLERETYDSKTRKLQRLLMNQIEKNIDKIELNGPADERASDNVNYSFRQIEGESIMMFLDFEGIIVATGSACASSDLKVNYILSAIGRDHEMAHGSLRITLGRETTEEDINRFVEQLIPIVKRLRDQSTIR